MGLRLVGTAVFFRMRIFEPSCRIYLFLQNF